MLETWRREIPSNSPASEHPTHVLLAATVFGRVYGEIFVQRALWLIDLVCVLVFVGIGRSVHSHGLSFAGMASTAWPFVTGLAVGWIVVTFRRAAEQASPVAFVVSVATVAVGMALRVIAGQGTAFAFVLVAFGFLGGHHDRLEADRSSAAVAPPAGCTS